MKNKLILTLFLLATAVTAYYFYIPPSPQISPPAPNNSNQFLFGAIQTYWDNYGPNPNNYQNYQTLGFNFWHTYIGAERIDNRWKPKGYISANDHLETPVSQYAQDLKNEMNVIQPHNQSRLLWQRPKIEWLCYGQRSDYQCENISTNHPLWFYSFQEKNGETMRDFEWNNGDSVLYCSDISSGPGAKIVIKRLKANTEQSHNDNSSTAWRGDSECDWLIKPRIRVPQSFVVPANYETPVCSLKVLGQDGQVLKEVIIKAKYFRDPQTLQYNGDYIEQYFDGTTPVDLTIHGAWGDLWGYKARGEHNPDWTGEYPDNHADIQVYWYDNCPMWIDYVRVDNDVADRLLNPNNPLYPITQQWIQEEAELACYKPDGVHTAVYKFYIELAEFNNLPCMAYVNEKLKYYSGAYTGWADTVDLMQDLTNYISLHVHWDGRITIENADFLYEHYIQKVGFRQVFQESYPMTSCYKHGWPPTTFFSKIPSTLPVTLGMNVLANAVEPSVYDTWLQDNLFHKPYGLEPGIGNNPVCEQTACYEDPNIISVTGLSQDLGNYRFRMQLGDALSKKGNIPFIFMPQVHHWFFNVEMRREPTNEELDVMANVAVTYGVRGMIYWEYPSEYWAAPCLYGDGIVDIDNNLIPENYYGQSEPKWHKIQTIGDRMKNKWGQYLLSFDNANRHSCTYNDDVERSEFLSTTYFNDVVSYERGEQPPYNECDEDSPNPYTSPEGWRYECKQKRYVQAAAFNMIAGKQVQYFMIVNRRASPLDPVNHVDGERYISVMFDQNSGYFPAYNNWKITEIGSEPLWTTQFDKTAIQYVLLGATFKPGEGRLYKIEPVLPTGGTLVADEYVSGETFTVEDSVFTNGYNLTVDNNTHISFTDTSSFVFTGGGSFTMGNSLYQGSPNISCGAVSGNSWNGFVFDSCEVRIYNSTFSGFGSDTSYALNMIDCPLIDIRNNAFSNSQNSTLGAINVTYYDIDSINNVYIENNTFELTNSVVPAVNILSYAGITTPLIIENNVFSSSTDNSTAILLSGITGGAVKSNSITNFKTGLNLLSSSIDVSENTVSSNLENSIGILAVSGSEIKMNPSGELQLGGMNNISFTETGSKNIKVDNSYFNMDYGENIFNIKEVSNSWHMNGWFDPFLQVSTNARENCFKVLDQPYAPPIENLKWGEGGSDIEFVFSPYLTGCIPEGCETYYIVDLGGGLYDTICVGGMGSGYLNTPRPYGTPLSRGELAGVRGSNISPYRGETQRGAVILNPKQAYDSLCIYMRLRNYAQAKNKCYELLNNYPDSIQSLNAVNKLFLAVTATDASQNGINQLKIYFETLILNHSGNTALVKRCNYFVQKCKVRMREYSSALTGFQQIISQNPTSYEGLVARWDYMATSLLMHGGGTGGISSIENYELGITNEEEAYKAFEFDLSDEALAKLDESDESFNDDNPFTREEKKAIRNAVNNVLNVSRESNDKRIEILKEKSDVGDVDAKRELEHINKMKEVVKTQKPKNVIEHIKIINSDIQKIFGGKSSNNKSPQNNIPVVYRLAQNYPNPFNPITTIKYEIPKDSKVKLVVYDLLGREVKTLVNNEIRSAGYYKIEFDMQNYASGVYFYRIEADDTKGNKFIDAKKMVLIK